MPAHVQIEPLHFCLRLVYCFRNHTGLYRRIFGEVQGLHKPADFLASEYAEKIVLKRQEKFLFPRIALATGAAAKLIVNSAGLMPFRAYYIKSA